MPMLSIDEVAEFSELAKKQLADLKRENDHMRATLANGSGPCAYCDLTRDQWSQCNRGFPGCPRGDDAMLCPHVGAGLDEDRFRVSLEWIEGATCATPGLTEAQLGRLLAVIGEKARDALGPNV